MAIIDTKTKIKFEQAPEGEYTYTFTPNGINSSVLVEGSDGKNRSFSIEALRRLARSNMEDYRVMALGALEAAGLAPEEEEEKEILSDTIVTILGIKVRQDLLTFKYVARIAGEIFRRKNLTEIEAVIKKET